MVDGPRRGGQSKPEGDEPSPRSTGRKKAKPAVEARPRPSPATDGELDDQIPPSRRRRSGRGDDRGYIRFRVRVEDGATRIVDSHVVDSELVMPPTLHGEYAYEVSDGTRLLHADSIPDLGVARSFSKPDGLREQRGHHTYRESTYEFDARAPVNELTRGSLSNRAIILYRVKEPAPTRALTRAVPLGEQFERELREVTRVSNIPPDAVPPSLR
jgi:hypothetical protein